MKSLVSLIKRIVTGQPLETAPTNEQMHHHEDMLAIQREQDRIERQIELYKLRKQREYERH